MPVPPLEGEITRHHDRRSRTWTVEHLPFDELPSFEPGMRSPMFVSIGGWQVHWYGDALYVYYPDTDTYHDLHGQRGYPTIEDARRAWYNAGVLGLWVYEHAAAEYGLPTTLAWTRTQPDIDTTGNGATQRRVTDARTAMWWRILDPGRDLTVDRWAGLGDGEDLYAVLAVSAYGAAAEDTDSDSIQFVEIEYGVVVCVDPDDPAETEITSRYVYETVAGATDASDEALDGYLRADIAATFRNLAAGIDMADCIWNGIVEEASLMLGASQ